MTMCFFKVKLKVRAASINTAALRTCLHILRNTRQNSIAYSNSVVVVINCVFLQFSVVLFAEFIRGKKAQKSQMGKSGSKPETSSGELDNPWRTFNWREKKELKKRLENFHLSNPEVSHVRILVAGQIGAGKSSFINSVCSAFQGEIVCEALADTSQSASSHSFTERMKVYRIRSGDADLPFEMCDVKGLEPEKISMALPEDIVNIIYGHVRDGYKFSKDKTLPKEDDHYNETPSLSDQAFCLVYVLAGDTLHLHADDNILFEKLRFIRQSISDNGIPQVIVMTKVDEACPLVKNDLKKVYLSKKIKEKMELCSLKLGVPMSNIFPVKNYSEEIDTDDNVDVLILKAFDQIVRFADGRLRRGASTKNS